MEWITGIQKAINYIEDHLDGEIDYAVAAKQAGCSESNFMRVFSVLSGYTLGEYVRSRRLSLAGYELKSTTERIIDVAMKYGYDSPESFTRAFVKFHGITPTEARRMGSSLRSFSPMTLKISIEGGRSMDYRIEEKPRMIFVGFKRKFSGKPDDMGKTEQREAFWISTREEQDVLLALRAEDDRRWYEISTDFTEDGYTQYISVLIDEQEDAFQRLKVALDELFEPEWTEKLLENIKSGVPMRNKVPKEGVRKEIADFDVRVVPAHTWAIFRGKEDTAPVMYVEELRRQIMSEWLPTSGYVMADAPEIVMVNWLKKEEKEKRYLEYWLPIEWK